jgi:hypothetical protein
LLGRLSPVQDIADKGMDMTGSLKQGRRAVIVAIVCVLLILVGGLLVLIS